MVTGGLDDARHAGKEGTFRIEDDVIGFAVDELFRIGDGGTEGLTDGLMAKADTEDGELSGKVRDRGDGDAGIFGTAWTGGEEESFGMHGFDFFQRIGVIADDSYIRIEAACELVEIVGKAVVVIDEKYHSRPPLAASMAVTMALALLMHS